jgi:hypothetical protein
VDFSGCLHGSDANAFGFILRSLGLALLLLLVLGSRLSLLQRFTDVFSCLIGLAFIIHGNLSLVFFSYSNNLRFTLFLFPVRIPSVKPRSVFFLVKLNVCIERQGFSYVIHEEDLTNETLLEGVNRVYKRRTEYIAAMQNAKQLNAAQSIYSIINDIVK